MSNRGNAIRLRQKMQGVLNERQPVLEKWVGLMGDGEGNLYPDPADLIFVFVRRTGRGRVERVRNTRVTARNNLPVIVGFSPERPDEQQVLDTDDTALTTLGAYGYVKNHHQQHELHNATGGDDTVWVYTQQFLYLLCQPTDPISTTLEVRPGEYAYQSVHNTFPGAITVDLTGFAPGAGLAVMVLIGVDANTATLDYTVSAAFAATLSESFRRGMVPAPPDGTIPTAAVYVPNAVADFDWDAILDWRVFINTFGDTPTHNILSATHTDAVTDSLTQGGLLVVGVGSFLEQLPIGAADEVFIVNAAGTDPEWGDVPPVSMPHTLLDGVAHTDTDTDAVVRGTIIVGDATPLWNRLLHLGENRHLTTDANDVIWREDIYMNTAHWIGIGDGAGEAHIEFITDAGLDITAILGTDVGIGSDAPNITGEALALTMESETSAPVIELSLKDSIFPVDTPVGIFRWISGDPVQCTVGQIDIVQSAWYEAQSTMRFWAADGCALCLRQEIDCDEVRLGDIAGGDYTVIEDDGSLSFQGDAVLKDPGVVAAQFLRLPGLRGFWPMSSVDYTAASRAIDLSDQGNHLTDNNTVEFGYDGLAPYVHFTAANNEYLSRADGGVGNWADIVGTEAYIENAYRGLTIGGWFYFETIAVATDTMAKWGAVGADRSYLIQQRNTNDIRFAVASAGPVNHIIDSSNTISQNRWHFIVGRYVPSTSVDIFLDDVKTSLLAGVPAAIQDGAALFGIGSGARLTSYVDGRASMCFLCATWLSDTALTSLFERTREMYGV